MREVRQNKEGAVRSHVAAAAPAEVFVIRVQTVTSHPEDDYLKRIGYRLRSN